MEYEIVGDRYHAVRKGCVFQNQIVVGVLGQDVDVLAERSGRVVRIGGSYGIRLAPVWISVPESTPPLLNTKPDGARSMVHRYGGVPPDAEKVHE